MGRLIELPSVTRPRLALRGKGWWYDIRQHWWIVVLWLALNIADTLLTYAIIHQGGAEIWLVHQLSGSMAVTTVAKYAGVVLVVVVLGIYGRLRWLPYFFVMVIPPLAWNIFSLAQW